MVDEFDQIFRECSPFSMIQSERFADNIRFLMDLRNRQNSQHGSIVECGVWKGGMALALTAIFGADRSYGFFDSFEGLPPPNTNDGQDAHFWASHPEHPRNFENCRAEVEDFRASLRTLRPKYNDISVVKGWFLDSLANGLPGEVAFAHLDCDWYDSVYLCLEHLWPRMIEGGVILIDDYYDWEGCRRAVHDFLSRHKAREAIRSVGNFGGVSITRLGDWTVAESPHLQ